MTHIWRFLFSKGPVYSLSYSFLCIFISILIFLPISLWMTLPSLFVFKQSFTPIKTLFLTCVEPPHLPEPFFSELLHLSADDPPHLQTFSTKSAEHFLKQTGIFSEISIDKVPDHKGLAISYALHAPLAFLGNKTHTFIGFEGQTFPALPFYSLQLPTVFVPQEALNQSHISSQILTIIKILINNLQVDPPSIIDLSQIDHYPSEFVVSLSSGTLLRFRKDSFMSGIKHYQQALNLGAFSSGATSICDLRCEDYLLLKRK
ncbi:conserved hypothetical protein [Chlamydia muridarum str. Nigg]|uniref:Cell division protein FtsQ n=1 Tax=Chlamydia muridarum (strain MoPn / Nigg) TaxID=243161 RepID=Q9PLF9_CHLMU|nr:conserved hypothetical protein [Chlamydia muridarum str. Nigg]AHH22537.1 hypothetical protein TAC_00775 [Chlamydia muridarum str. Nigg3 CMUT3-5]AHH23461.1 hypothetical protein Y015_00775 [Chlamydia muridarum str. Nigg CM972]